MTHCGSESDPYTFSAFFPFCGIGGAALGFQQASARWRGAHGRFRILGGIDVDAAACADFEMLTGVPATRLDLFSRADYTAFHGHEPPSYWRAAIKNLDRALARRAQRTLDVGTAAP